MNSIVNVKTGKDINLVIKIPSNNTAISMQKTTI